MKKNILIIVVIVISLVAGGYYFYNSKESHAEKELYAKYEKQAEVDIQKNQKKYYHFGFVPMNKQNELYDVLEKNNVQIINMSCAAIPELVHYNDVILKEIK